MSRVTGKPCLVCGSDLDKANVVGDVTGPTGLLTVWCACGMGYPLRATERITMATWLDVFRGKGYRVDQDEEGLLVLHNLSVCEC